MQVVLVATAMLAGCSLIWAPPLPDDPSSIFSKAKPATVLVWGEVSAHCSVSDWWISDDAFAMADKAWAAGEVKTDAEWSSYVVRVIAGNPDRYILPHGSAPREVEASFSIMGSGFIADPDGFVVTSAHVAALTEDEIKDKMYQHGLEQWHSEDEQWINENLTDLSEQDAAALLDAVAEFNAANMEVTHIRQDYRIYMAAGAAGSTSHEGIPCSVVEAGTAAPGKDIAILKIDAANLPTIPLGDDGTVDIGDEVFAVGYPYDATFSPSLSKGSFPEPSFTSGVVSARKAMTGGFDVIQLDAAIQPGNSGGPVLDAGGRVVGVATFSLGEDEDASFVMPTTIVNEFLNRAGAEPRESTFTKLYNDALEEEAAGHLKDALGLYERVDGVSPGHPYVLERIGAVEQGIAEGHDRELSVLALIIPVAFAVLVVFAVVLLRRARS